MTVSNIAELLEKQENRFILIQEENTLHDRMCSMLKKTMKANVEAFEYLNPNDASCRFLCPICRRRLAVRNGIRDQMRNSRRYLGFYMSFFDVVAASDDDLIQLFVTGNGSINYISDVCVQINVHEDSWRITSANRELLLYHNNYLSKLL